MSTQLLSSKTIVQEDQPSARNIQGVATGVLACLGITQKGPVNLATQLFSEEQFIQIFGSDIGVGYAAGAIKAFFEGGGRRAYFTRVVHHEVVSSELVKTSRAGFLNILSRASTPAPAQTTGSVVGPFALAAGDTLVINRDAAGDATATFTATAASVTTDEEAPFALVNGQTVILRIDGGAPRTVVFDTSQFVDIGEATAEEVALAMQSALSVEATVADVSDAVSITSKMKGTGSHVEIVGGTAAVVLGLQTGIASGGGNVIDITAVKVSEIKTIVEAAAPGITVTDFGGAVRLTAVTVGVTGALTVKPASTADDELGLDNLLHNGTTGAALPTLRIDAKYDGVYSNSITVLITPATSGIDSEFNLTTLVGGVAVETTFANLSMFNGAERHVEKIINATDSTGSRYIQATDLRIAPGSATAGVERPANSGGSPAVAYGPLSGGNDGLAAVAETDFVGDKAARTGFYSFDLVDDLDLLICPEVASPAVHSAALTYCSITRNGELFFIADPPAGLSPEGIVTYNTVTAALKNTTEHGAIYWPRVKVLNPNPAVYGTSPTITVPPSGHIAGMYSRSDNSKVGGVYQPPGGVQRGQLPGVIGLENDLVLSEDVRDYITPALINPITRLRGQPIAVNDVLTLRSTGAFPTIAERRGVSFIERSIKDGIEWARLENNDETLRCAIERTARLFLIQQMRVGAFRSQNPQTAFFIDVGEALNPPSEQFAGKVNIRIGLATQKPARWIILTFAQDTRALDAELAAAS